MATLWLLMVGLFFVAVVVFWPDGIMGIINKRLIKPEFEE